MREREREKWRERKEVSYEHKTEGNALRVREKYIQVQHTAFHHHTSTHLSIFFEDFHCFMLVF